MSLKDQIEALLRERGPMTVPEMMRALFPGIHDYETTNKRTKIYSKCVNLAGWGKIERTGEKRQNGEVVWKAVE